MLAQGSLGSGALLQQASVTSHPRPRAQLQAAIGLDDANAPGRGCMSGWESARPLASWNSGCVPGVSELLLVVKLG